MNNFIQVQTKMTISHLGRGTRQGRQKKEDWGIETNSERQKKRERKLVGGGNKAGKTENKGQGRQKTKDRDAGDHCWKTAPSHQALNRE